MRGYLVRESRRKKGGRQRPSTNVVTQRGGDNKYLMKVLGCFVAIALVVIALGHGAGYKVALPSADTPTPRVDPLRIIPSVIQPAEAEPTREPVNPASCAGRLYGGEVCVDHFGADRLYIFRTGEYRPKTSTRPYGLYIWQTNTPYEAMVFLQPLHKMFLRWDWSEFAMDKVKVRNRTVPLVDVLSDIEGNLGKIVAEVKAVKHGAESKSGNELRFSIGGALFTWTGVVTAAVYTFCVYGAGKGYCADLLEGGIEPEMLRFNSATGWRMNGRLARTLLLYTRLSLPDDFIGNGRCESLRRDTFLDLFATSSPSQDMKSLMQEAREVCGGGRY